MGLIRLDCNNRSLLESKNVYFAGFSPVNMDFFFERFPEYKDSICGVFAILEIDDRTQLSVKVGERDYEVRNLCEAALLDPDKDIVIIMYEYENEAYDKLLKIISPKNVSIFWFPDRAAEIELQYRDMFRDNELEDIILFRSGPRVYVYGDDFSDNSRALFEYMIKNQYNKSWRLVWLVNEPNSSYYDEWRQKENVFFIDLKDKESADKEKRDTYYRYLCLAKFAFVTDDEIFFKRRRHDQTLVQLWHGDGVKGRTRFRRMEKRFEYMVCTSQFFADVDYVDYGLRPDQMLPCGYPKDDWVLSNETDELFFLEKKEMFNHFILWGPTFRKSVKGLEIVSENVKVNETGLPILTTWGDYAALNECLKNLGCLLVIKLHPIADLSLYENKQFSNIIMLTNQDLFSHGFHINQIMPVFDAFITDYSSASTSFMILDRPMAFTLDDLDEFDNSRGFVLTPVQDYLPGKELYSVSDMKEFIEEVCEGRDSSSGKRRKLIEKMLDYGDGGNSRRLLNRLNIEK